MSAPSIIANLIRGWNTPVASVLVGTNHLGVSAGLWTKSCRETQETSAEPDPSHHILCFNFIGVDGEMRVDERIAFVGPFRLRSAHLIRAGERPRAVVRGPVKSLRICLPGTLVDNLAASLEVGVQHVELIDPACSIDPAIERIAREIVSEMKAEQALSQLRVDMLGQDLAIQLLRRWSTVGGTRRIEREFARGGLAPWQERRTVEYLRSTLAEDVTLDRLAEIANLSSFHFARMFRLSTGLPPFAYQRRLRCERARELLVETDLPITEIAAQVGYDTPQAFARMFRGEAGMSPSAYRQEHRN